MADHLGTSRIVASSAGAILDESDFYPFGGERVISTSSGNTYKFTGKERDSESGLDNFGARYDSSATGRFMSVDPSNKSINKLNPQSWNRYTYTLNNPLRFVDDNGKWSREIHEQIIDRAFPGLSATQRNQLKQTSAWVDRIAGQTKAHSHEHAMRGPDENPADARRAIDQNIQNHEQAAQRAQGGTPEHAGQIDDGALKEFGQALHTVEDRTSPAHTDQNGDPQVWNGIPTSNFQVLGAEAHEAEEENITPEQMNNAVEAARGAFGQTFGQQALTEAMTPPTPAAPSTIVLPKTSFTGQKY